MTTTRRRSAEATDWIDKFPVVTVVVLVLLVTGCIDILIDGDLSPGYRDLLQSLDEPILGLALGKGLVGLGRHVHRP